MEADAAGGGIGAGMEIGLNAEQMTFHAIRGSRATLYAGTEHKEITYYVTAPVEGAYVSILPFSEDAEVSYELRVERTAAGSRMTFVKSVQGKSGPHVHWQPSGRWHVFHLWWII